MRPLVCQSVSSSADLSGTPVEAGHVVGKADFIEINQGFSLLLIAAYFLPEQVPPLSLPWGNADFFIGQTLYFQRSQNGFRAHCENGWRFL
ncbi:hypothetical protein BA171_00305 [Candidatus Hamiltonella defensa (Bemisia tabaci)]|uniref:Uncharacterized protein n=1 Tax=Candidatus Hamiltonella defensa (Bemisia tabaci) TaxID=672795 RepID=A0A249DWN7_9ENTR|nr:hypothetical protein BA171_00305 [Candidatus Hamiltonella defensa (Bemisia tabaci)]